jgi:hypothetical protein
VRKVVERAFARGTLAYQGIRVEPDERTLVVVILEALIVGP